MNTVAIKRRLVEGAQKIAKQRDVGMEDIVAVTQPLAELIAVETGIDVEVVLKIKKGRKSIPVAI